MLHRVEAHCVRNKKYKVTRSTSSYYNLGDIVELMHDDRTSCPKYRILGTDKGAYIYCDNLKPYVEKNIVGGNLL